MIYRILLFVMLAFAVAACNNTENNKQKGEHAHEVGEKPDEHEHESEHAHEVEESHDGHEHESEHAHEVEESHDGHQHESEHASQESESHDGHEHEGVDAHEESETQDEQANEHQHDEIKVQYTAYNYSYELFAEADVFIVGETANVLSHFSKLPGFEALDRGAVSIILTVNGKTVKQTLGKPTRKGIYSFDITPEVAGTGTLSFRIDTSEITETDVEVFANQNEADIHAEHEEASQVNTINFTKEQSWKINFKTELPHKEPFGQVIKTVAKIEPTSGTEIVISAKTSGIIVFSDLNILEGYTVSKGQKLFAISTSGMSENNISVQLAQAKNNFENAEADYIRKKELANEKIISEKELQSAENQYENSKAVYENLTNNFSASGQSISSSMTGFVKQIFVSNGQFVGAGQPLITISQNQKLVLNAFVQQRYIGVLSAINSANIKTLHDNETYTFDELNGKVLSYGKSASEDNYLLPVYIQIDNKGSFVQGSFVQIYLKTLTNLRALTVPNSALLEEQGSYFVLVQKTPELFEKREIKIGATDGVRTEIISGLLQTEMVISKGAMLVKLSQSAGALDAHSGHVH
ncbi:MAG: efflux RND transporter periplasmic adaptor subunit [Salinivirgaceae bacterium]|jgi:cobalt-zinc-cadmium efflux system membrane fusion protein|nr:efflux RND transporter periplasmic adaptor subunit [Salinivirgaceae bacterium]